MQENKNQQEFEIADESRKPEIDMLFDSFTEKLSSLINEQQNLYKASFDDPKANIFYSALCYSFACIYAYMPKDPMLHLRLTQKYLEDHLSEEQKDA